mgnify:CR=1 FL=1
MAHNGPKNAISLTEAPCLFLDCFEPRCERLGRINAHERIGDDQPFDSFGVGTCKVGAGPAPHGLSDKRRLFNLQTVQQKEHVIDKTRSPCLFDIGRVAKCALIDDNHPVIAGEFFAPPRLSIDSPHQRSRLLYMHTVCILLPAVNRWDITNWCVETHS